MTVKHLHQPLISLRNITRDVKIDSKQGNVKRLLNCLNWELYKGQRVGVLAKSMQEAHAFLDCAAGVSKPQKGHVSIQANVSWPLGSKGGLFSSLSGRQNARLLQGIYGHGSQLQSDLNLIERLADLREGYFEKPLKSYDKEMRARFYLAVSLIFDFDVYVIPQHIALKSNNTSEKFIRLQKALKDRTFGKSVLMTNSDFRFVEQFCDQGLVLDQGSIAYSGSFSECRAWYETNISKTPEEDVNLELDSEEDVSTTELNSDNLDDEMW